MAKTVAVDIGALADAISETMEEVRDHAAVSNVWAIRLALTSLRGHISTLLSHNEDVSASDIKQFIEGCHLGGVKQ